MPAITTNFLHHSGDPNQGSKAKTGKKKAIRTGKEGGKKNQKTTTVYRWSICVYRESPDKLLLLKSLAMLLDTKSVYKHQLCFYKPTRNKTFN